LRFKPVTPRIQVSVARRVAFFSACATVEALNPVMDTCMYYVWAGNLGRLQWKDYIRKGK